MSKRLHNICLRGLSGKGRTLPAAALAALFLLANPGALAEETLATLRGTVRAPTGVSISETPVVAKNSETGQRREVSSGAEGQFVIQQLPPGTYDVEASRAGFGSRMQKGVELRAGQLPQLAFVLEAASGTQSQEVPNDNDQNGRNNQDASEAETSSAAVSNRSNRIDESQLVGLPLNGRSYSQLATLQAGVSDTSGASGA